MGAAKKAQQNLQMAPPIQGKYQTIANGWNGGNPAPSKVQSSNLASPPVQSEQEEEIGQSSEGHLDAGIYSDDHN
jgi:hypothetical protein